MRRREISSFFVAGLAVALTALGTLVAIAQPMSVRTSRRIIAAPTRVLAKEVESRPAPPAAPASTTECPQMSNPGGLRWEPSRDAGPWATNGVVRLPRFGVTAPIVRVGVDMSSSMVVPHNARQVAWLDQGPYPGDTNNPVLAGHINYSRVAGSFSRLTQMRPGDIIEVDIDGKHFQYRVTWTCLFDRDSGEAERIMGYTDVPSVTLISCGGVFDRSARTHNKRVAVRGELVGQT
jgi:LPXTG-site transpeptidase (sortase) family protein